MGKRPPTHGQQFRARFLRTSPPTSADGIEKYLARAVDHLIGASEERQNIRAYRT